GVINGSGSLTKAGSNLVSLGATNTYTGSTTVSEGILNVLPGGPITPSVAASGAIFVGSISNVPAVMTNAGTIVCGTTAFQVGAGSDLIGTFNMGGGSLTVNSAARIGSEPADLFGINPGNGTFNLSGGTVLSTTFWQVGRNLGVGT